MEKFIWVFNGENGRFPSGVFSDVEIAKQWIEKHQLSGILTRYPLDTGVYDWAVKNDHFKITKDKHKTPLFIGLFSSAHQEHIHFESGK